MPVFVRRRLSLHPAFAVPRWGKRDGGRRRWNDDPQAHADRVLVRESASRRPTSISASLRVAITEQMTALTQAMSRIASRMA